MTNTPSHIYFQKIIDILKIIQDKIDLKTDVVWTSFDTPQQLKDDLSKKIELLKSQDYMILSDISILFGPTGAYQELSISNGWSHEYLDWATKFDYYYQKLISS